MKPTRVIEPESKVLADCMQFLNLQPGVEVWRRNSGVVFKGKRCIRYGKKDSADIEGVLAPHGRHIECEVKATGEVPTDKQAEWLALMTERGCIAFYADSLAMCIEKWEALGSR